MLYFKNYLHGSFLALCLGCGCAPLANNETAALREQQQAELRQLGKKPLKSLAKPEQKKAITVLKQQINQTSQPFKAFCQDLEPDELRKCLEFYQHQASTAKNLESIFQNSPLSPAGTSKYIELLAQLQAQLHITSNPANDSTNQAIQKKITELFESEFQSGQAPEDLSSFISEASTLFTAIPTWKPSPSIKAIKTLAQAEKAQVAAELRRQVSENSQFFISFCYNKNPAKKQRCLEKFQQKALVSEDLSKILSRSPLSRESTSKYILWLSQIFAEKDINNSRIKASQKKLDLILKTELKIPQVQKDFQVFNNDFSNCIIKLYTSPTPKPISNSRDMNRLPTEDSNGSFEEVDPFALSANLEILENTKHIFFESITAIAQLFHENAKEDAVLATTLSTIKSLPYELLEYPRIKALLTSLSDNLGLIDILDPLPPEFQQELLNKFKLELELAAINQLHEPITTDEFDFA